MKLRVTIELDQASGHLTVRGETQNAEVLPAPIALSVVLGAWQTLLIQTCLDALKAEQRIITPPRPWDGGR